MSRKGIGALGLLSVLTGASWYYLQWKEHAERAAYYTLFLAGRIKLDSESTRDVVEAHLQLREASVVTVILIALGLAMLVYALLPRTRQMVRDLE